MEYLTVREKFDLLNDTPRENAHELERMITEGVVSDRPRVSVRFDIRAFIRRRMAEEGISQNDLARRLGKPQPNICNFLNGKIPLPLDTIEEIIWLFAPNNCGHDVDDHEIRILREETL